MDRDFDTPQNELKSLGTDDNSSFKTRGIALLFALGLTAALLGGYMALRWRHAKRVEAEQAAENQKAKPTPSPKLQLFVDEAMMKGSQAVIAGTLLNISNEKLTDLTVEVELKRRKDGVPEKRTLKVEPSDLEPEAQGRYSISVPSGEYRESRVLQVKSNARSNEVAFKTVPGAQRPPERLPQTTKTIIVKPTPHRGKGEEFINTPDTPVTVH